MIKFLAVFDRNGERQCHIYTDIEAYFCDIFSPDCELIYALNLSGLSGRTYAEKKANLEEKAIEYSNNMSEIYPISYGEIAEIEEYFGRYARRYGLLGVFRENAIC